MAHLIAQGGSTLYKVDLTTGVATALTLPTGVTLATSRKPKFAVLNQWVVVVNTPSRNLAIDPEGTVRVLVPAGPTHGPTVAAGAGTGLTGAYLFKESFIVLNSDGELLMESPLSPPSVSVTLTNQNASLTDLARSLDTITARRLYRTTAGGSLYFRVLDHDGNVSEALVNGTADATLSLLPALSNTLTTPPGTLPGIRFKNIVEWKSRLWAIADDPGLVDTVFASETNKIYAWPNSLIAYPTGWDKQGIIGFAPRRNQLGLLKRNGLWAVSGSSSGTGISFSNISVSQIASGKAGSLAPDTIVVINDRAYWLGNDGVYEWSDEGVINITNETVAPWFKTDTYFNRSRFPSAFAKYNELRNSYDLHLAAVGSSVEDRWVSVRLETKKWYGPHLTAEFTPSHAAHLVDENGLPVMLMGGTNGVIYTGNSANYRDGASTPIDMDVFPPFHFGNAPDIDHYWGQLSMLSKVEVGGTLTITPTVGRLNTAAGTAFTHDLTTGRERLRRLGTGAGLRIRLRQATVNQGCVIYGYEIPYHELGRR